MQFADEFWRKSVAAQTNLSTAVNYSVAFCGNAAVQSVNLTLTTPLVFWSAMSRAMERVSNEQAARNDSAVVVDLFDQPKEAPVEEIAVQVAEPAETVEKPAKVEAPTPNPLLLDEPRGGKADDLTLIKGIGAKMAASLNEFGIYHIDQVAGLDENGVAWIDKNLQGFKRNCARFDVVGSAASLL